MGDGVLRVFLITAALQKLCPRKQPFFFIWVKNSIIILKKTTGNVVKIDQEIYLSRGYFMKI